MFTGWPLDATAFLTEITADNTPAFWAAHRHRHDAAVAAPTRALAAELEAEFGPLRVLRPYRNRRFSPDAPPYRTDCGVVGAGRGLVLSAAALTVTAGVWMFDGGQLRRYRAGVCDGPPVVPDGFTLDHDRALTGLPRGFRSDHPQLGWLRQRGLQVTRSWPVGEWISTPEPLERVRAAWREAAPLLDWLDAHVGPADPTQPRPRPAGAEPVVERTSAAPAGAGGPV